MDEKMHDVVLQMDINYHKLSKTEKKIAEFFQKNIHKSYDHEFLSANNMKNRLHVSSSTLSRFANKIGYSGYREFVFAYCNNESRLAHVHIKSNGIVSNVLDIYTHLLEKEREIIDESQIDRIIEYLGKYKRIIVCGKGSSSMAAEEMEFRFMRMGLNIDAITSEDRMRMQSVFMDKSCFVIGLSLSGTTEDVLYMLKTAHDRGARTMLVTAYDRGYERFCDEVVLIPSYQNMEYGNSISPQFPMLVLQDILYNKYLEKNKYINNALHKNTIKALRRDKNENL